jgi:hypothetical protein
VRNFTVGGEKPFASQPPKDKGRQACCEENASAEPGWQPNGSSPNQSRKFHEMNKEVLPRRELRNLIFPRMARINADKTILLGSISATISEIRGESVVELDLFGSKARKQDREFFNH